MLFCYSNLCGLHCTLPPHAEYCQIIRDSLHSCEEWTCSYLLRIDGPTGAYGFVVVSGQGEGKPTMFEFYLLPRHRARLFDRFFALLTESGATLIEAYTNGARRRRKQTASPKPLAPKSTTDGGSGTETKSQFKMSWFS